MNKFRLGFSVFFATFVFAGTSQATKQTVQDKPLSNSAYQQFVNNMKMQQKVSENAQKEQLLSRKLNLAKLEEDLAVLQNARKEKTLMSPAQQILNKDRIQRLGKQIVVEKKEIAKIEKEINAKK